MNIHKLPARAGMRWFKLGWQTFWRQPLALGLLFALLLAGSILVACLPTVGMALSEALHPWLTMTMMVAVGLASAGQRVRPAALLQAMHWGGRQQRGLLVLGALYLLAFVCLLGLTALFDGGTLASAYMGKDSGMLELLTNPPAQGLLSTLLSVAAVLLALLLWPACGLVYWHGVSPGKAVFLTIAATLRNWRPFLVLSLVSIVSQLALMLGIVLLFILIGLVTGMSGLLSMVITGALLFAFMLSAVICSASIFFSFRDCFAAAPAAPAAQD